MAKPQSSPATRLAGRVQASPARHDCRPARPYLKRTRLDAVDRIVVCHPRADPRVLCADPGSMVRLSSTNSVIQSRHLMATVEKISIALTGDLAALVGKDVESGDYASTSEVIRDALRDGRLKRARSLRRSAGNSRHCMPTRARERPSWRGSRVSATMKPSRCWRRHSRPTHETTMSCTTSAWSAAMRGICKRWRAQKSLCHHG